MWNYRTNYLLEVGTKVLSKWAGEVVCTIDELWESESGERWCLVWFPIGRTYGRLSIPCNSLTRIIRR